ncbi:small acid-soluble spore protein P [Paenibacillus sp.]|uniref:small acid-soluble spore protein P n=1 Tax=Paenibacillus sp. TaxID=58172 RepID=UPI002D6E1A8C|nr:small acid-soluble spore protein P [Paenibacillus sp.]HZG87278.1 small acid-soluble spore protein P [Paenibacillus sp.]
MSKRGTFTIDPHIGQNHENPAKHRKDPAHPVEPLSGSKKVKNRQHSRANHGEGS